MSCHDPRERAEERAQRDAERAFGRLEAQRVRQERQRQMWSAAWSGAVNGAVNGVRGTPPAQAQVRIGDAERESAVSALGEHYVAGRLSKEEFDERTDRAWAARTSGDLSVLFSDLPRLAPPAPASRPRQRPHHAWRLGAAFFWVFVILLVMAGTGHVPWFALAIFGGLWWTGALSALFGRSRRVR